MKVTYAEFTHQAGTRIAYHWHMLPLGSEIEIDLSEVGNDIPEVFRTSRRKDAAQRIDAAARTWAKSRGLGSVRLRMKRPYESAFLTLPNDA